MKAGETWNGTVKWYNSARGRGYITADSGLDVFVHHTGIAGTGVRSLDEDSRVRFELSEKDGQWQALNVRSIDE